jgi:hypothetical protein
MLRRRGPLDLDGAQRTERYGPCAEGGGELLGRYYVKDRVLRAVDSDALIGRFPPGTSVEANQIGKALDELRRALEV